MFELHLFPMSALQGTNNLIASRKVFSIDLLYDSYINTYIPNVKTSTYSSIIIRLTRASYNRNCRYKPYIRVRAIVAADNSRRQRMIPNNGLDLYLLCSIVIRRLMNSCSSGYVDDLLKISLADAMTFYAGRKLKLIITIIINNVLGAL